MQGRCFTISTAFSKRTETLLETTSSRFWRIAGEFSFHHLLIISNPLIIVLFFTSSRYLSHFAFSLSCFFPLFFSFFSPLSPSLPNLRRWWFYCCNMSYAEYICHAYSLHGLSYLVEQSFIVYRGITMKSLPLSPPLMQVRFCVRSVWAPDPRGGEWWRREGRERNGETAHRHQERWPLLQEEGNRQLTVQGTVKHLNKGHLRDNDSVLYSGVLYSEVSISTKCSL